MGRGAVLAVAALVAYSRTFSVPLVFDDYPSIVYNPTLRHFLSAFWPPSGTTVGGRPVVNLTLAANFAVSGTEVGSYHAVNLAIHILAGLTLFAIVRRTLAPAKGRQALVIAFCAALLWLLHPLQTESVTYVVQRAESLMGLLYLLTLYCFIRGAESEGTKNRFWYDLCVVACFLGMATKEVMVTAPLVVLLYDRTFLAGTLRGAWQRRRRVYIGLAATWIILPFLVFATHGRGGTAGFGTGVSWWSYTLTQFPAILHYLRLCFWPFPLVFDYGSTLYPVSLELMGDALLVAVLAGLTVWALKKKPVLGFLGACFFLILAPTSSIIPVATETMAEHRMYLALIPVVILVVAGLFQALGRAALPCCVILAAGLLGATWHRNNTYRSEEGLLRDTVSKMPGNERAHNNLGYKLSTEPGMMDEAIAEYEEALRLNPRYNQAHNNLGTALVTIPGRMDDAIAEYEEALRLEPNYPEAHYNLANALATIPGMADEAIAHYKEALRLEPDYAAARYNFACALDKMPGGLGDAIDQYDAALRLRPDMVEAHYNLGRDLEKVPGRTDDAIAQYREALRLRPEYAEAHYNLARDLQKDPGKLDEAIAEYEEAARLKPDFVQAHFNLGFALAGMPGRMGEAIAQYEDTLRLRPDFAQAHFNLAFALESVPGRLGDAIAHYEEAVRLKPDYVEAHFNLGNALNTAGRTDDAVVQYEAAAALEPGDAAIQVGLGVALMRVPGRLAEAVGHLKEALRLEPGNEIARRTLDQISQVTP